MYCKTKLLLNIWDTKVHNTSNNLARKRFLSYLKKLVYDSHFSWHDVRKKPLFNFQNNDQK